MIEVSNGTGRSRMATRLGYYFEANGLRVQRLTNADGFSVERSVVFYRPGFEAAAELLAALLPVDVVRRADDALAGDIRLLVGQDLLAFDRFLTSLLQLERDAAPA